MSDQISLSTSDDSRNTSEISSNYAENPLEAYFTSVVSQRTDDGRDLAPTFTYLPSRNVSFECIVEDDHEVGIGMDVGVWGF